MGAAAVMWCWDMLTHTTEVGAHDLVQEVLQSIGSSPLEVSLPCSALNRSQELIRVRFGIGQQALVCFKTSYSVITLPPVIPPFALRTEKADYKPTRNKGLHEGRSSPHLKRNFQQIIEKLLKIL